MPTQGRQHSSQVASSVHLAAVELINERGVEFATAAAICDRAGVTSVEFEEIFGSVNAVFVGVVQSMLAAYGERVAQTLQRRRSLNDSIRIAHVAFMEVVEERFADQQALLALRLADLVRPGVVKMAATGMTLEVSLTANTEMWLIEVGRLHEIQWELPVAELARLLSASLTGVVIDYLARRDMDVATRMLEIISFDLARRGRRTAKNRSY